MKFSFSQYEVYSACPHWYEQRFIKKVIKPEKNEILDKGIRIHKGIEKFLRGKTDELPPEVEPSWRPHYESLRGRDGLQLEVKYENDIALGYIDVLAPGLIGDHKSGKARIGDILKREQLRFYTWLIGPEVKNWRGLLWFVEHPIKKATLDIPCNYTKTLDRVWRIRLEKLGRGPYPKTENWKCAYCPLVNCEFNKVEPTCA